MLLMRHERQGKAATASSKRGETRRRATGRLLEALWSAEPKALLLAPAKVSLWAVIDGNRVGGDGVVVAWDSPGEAGTLVSLKPEPKAPGSTNCQRSDLGRSSERG